LLLQGSTGKAEGKLGEEQQLWMQNEDKELRTLAGRWCRLGYRLAAVLGAGVNIFSALSTRW
jgi:hypothetical protein